MRVGEGGGRAPLRVPVEEWAGSVRIAGNLGRTLFLLGIGVTMLQASQSGRFWQAYFVWGLFCLTVSLGALFLVCLLHASRAAWSVLVRRPLEHLAGSLPWISLGLIPLILGRQDIFPWLNRGHPEWSALRQAYLAPALFWARSALWLLSWSVAGWWLRRQSLLIDEKSPLRASFRLRSSSPALLVWLVVSVSFAAFDWLMALSPAWASTIFGLYFLAGCACAGLSLWVLWALALGSAVTPSHRRQLGKLLFGASALWAYLGFSQFLVIWYGNMPEETFWYAVRLNRGWQWLALSIVAARFLLPFSLLLSRSAKERPALLVAAAALGLSGQLLDLYWIIGPVFRTRPVPGLLEGSVGLVWSGFFLMMAAGLGSRAYPIPQGDPRLAESVEWWEA